MLRYCLGCKKDRENVDWKVTETKKGKTMLLLLLKCTVCSSKKMNLRKKKIIWNSIK